MGGSGGDGAEAPDNSAAVAACYDVVEAFAHSTERCGFEYQANYDAALHAFGGCDDAISVRDIGSLYSDCIPFLSSLTCDQVNNPYLALPPSCLDQIEK